MNSTVKTPWKKTNHVWADNDKNYRLHLTMEDGEKFELDLTPLLLSRDAFWRLKAFRYFRQVAIAPLGGLYWPEVKIFPQLKYWIILHTVIICAFEKTCQVFKTWQVLNRKTQFMAVQSIY